MTPVSFVLAAMLVHLAHPASGSAHVSRRPLPAGHAVHALALRGRVVDSVNAPLAGVTVSLLELSRAAVTGRDGMWAFENVPAGAYHISVQLAGYAPVMLEAAGSESTTPIRIVLRATSLQLDAVTVTATRSATDALHSPLPSATLSGESLRREHSVSIGRAVERLPGVRNVTTGEFVGKPMIRGLFGARVLTLDNGMRLEDYSWSDEDAPSVESRLAQQIEVIRGPASVLYGSDAIGGVVNVLPHDLPDAQGRSPFTRTAAEVYVASNNTEGGAALKLDGARGGTGFRIFGVGRVAGDFTTPNGKLKNTGLFVGNGDAAVGFRSSRGNTTVRFTHYGGEFKLLEATPPATPPPAGDAGPVRIALDERLQVAGSYLFGTSRLEPKLQFQRHNMAEVSDDLSPAGSTVETEVFNLLLNTLSGDLLWHHLPNENVRGTIGVSGIAEQSGSRGPRTIVPNADIGSGAVFAFEELTAGQWSLLGGARIDQRHITAKANTQLALAENSRNYSQFTGDVGAVFRPVTHVALAANVGSAWRAPTLFEMYANGPRIGENRYDIGSPALIPEKGLNVDASIRWETPVFRGEVAAFRNLVQHFIFAYPTGETDGPLRVYRTAQADGEFIGGEALAETRLSDQVTVRGKYDMVRGQNKALNEPLPLVPPERGSLEGEFRAPHVAWADDAHAGVEAEHMWSQTRLSPYDTPTGAYTLVHVDAGIARQLVGRPVRIDLRVRNIANTSYTNYLSRYKLFSLDPGRNVIVRVSTGL